MDINRCSLSPLVHDTGPYRIGRQPIYTGIIAAAIALALVKGTLIAIGGALLAAFGFCVKARLEESFLHEQLGAEAYDAYRPVYRCFCHSIRPKRRFRFKTIRVT